MEGDTGAHGCFLCEPDKLLTFFRDAGCFAMCGLGPIVPHYSLVATDTHIPSASDALLESPNILAAVSHVVGRFNARGVRCVIAEHGRVPVCAERIGHERHCYHAHLLVFPGATWPTVNVAPIFQGVHEYSSFEEGLRAAPHGGEYYLLSDNLEKTVIYTEPNGAPRQFLRALLAASEKVPELADWHARPAREEALNYASDLRSFFGDDNGI